MNIGTHYILELCDCPVDRLTDETFVKESLGEAAVKAGATLLEEVSHGFHPHGVTAIGLLAESHISIHTWPELGYAAADIFTCGDHAMPEKACHILIGALKPGRYHLRKLSRGPAPMAMEAHTPELVYCSLDDNGGSELEGEREDEPCQAPSLMRISG